MVANGIPDPCPDFETRILPRRRARVAVRRKLRSGQTPLPEELRAAGDGSRTIRALFLAHCTREKGLFDAVQAALAAAEQLRAQRSPLDIRLIVGGSFQNAEERQEFERLRRASPSVIEYAGFLQGADKERALIEADLLCFPSHWDNQPVTVIEALAFGLPVVVSALPSVREMLRPGFPGGFELGNPAQMATAMLDAAAFEDPPALRQHYVATFSVQTHLTNLATAIHGLEKTEMPPEFR